MIKLSSHFVGVGPESESESHHLQMFPAIKLQVSNPAVPFHRSHITCKNLLSRRPSDLRLPVLRFSSLSLQSDDDASGSAPSPLTSSVGSPLSLHLSHWNLNHRHILILNLTACAAAVSATWLFFSAIPTLLRAAESLEKLLDVTREELPDTMAAVRLSGMEISDLTMELSDLGLDLKIERFSYCKSSPSPIYNLVSQTVCFLFICVCMCSQGITQGVRSSTRAVRLAEDRLRRLTTTTPTALVQEVANPKSVTAGPVLARTARGLREGIVKGRAILQIFFTLTRFSRLARNYFTSRGPKP
ncbi:hypothetical protein HHK36_004104 [Tetracentron sinense]|uniref:Transmembrane protein n=1 Tax=Tetracentron sinense TaxID=13715 RepID=A0A834ZU87_TETSI|nr:hypothetical protein HHK36_004104 [Tetracentron sinense]